MAACRSLIGMSQASMKWCGGNLSSLDHRYAKTPHAADALAVAYETMRRVKANILRVTAQLKALGYTFAREPHELPGPKVRRQIAQLEKMAGILPLSLRAFYEVGAVDWIGEHPGLVPRMDS